MWPKLECNYQSRIHETFQPQHNHMGLGGGTNSNGLPQLLDSGMHPPSQTLTKQATNIQHTPQCHRFWRIFCLWSTNTSEVQEKESQTDHVQVYWPHSGTGVKTAMHSKDLLNAHPGWTSWLERITRNYQSHWWCHPSLCQTLPGPIKKSQGIQRGSLP